MKNTQVGPFLVLERLGSHRRTRVWRARQVEQNREVALTFIDLPEDVPREIALRKIDQESRALQELQHANLVKLFGAGVDGERVFFASEIIAGESLTALLSRRGKLTPDLAIEIGSQVCTLLVYFHEQDYVLGQLKPDRIMLGDDGAVKVCNVRINRSGRRRWDFKPKRPNPEEAAYMAPERYAEGPSERTDLYALGVILFEMLTGKLPYAPETIGRMTKRKKTEPVPSVASQVMNCPVWLDEIVTQMLQPNPRSRPHTARAVSLAFREIKKIDRSQKAAVAQISGSFNPLTAGKDKSEARKILEHEKPKRELQPDAIADWFRSVPFLILALIAIAGVVTWAVWPPSTGEIFDRAVELVESDDSSNWARGRSELKKVISRGQGPFYEPARQHMIDSRRKTLLAHAERGINIALQPPNVRDFIEAWQLEADEKHAEAVAAYDELVEKIGDSERHQYVAFEAKARAERLRNLMDLPIAPDALMQILLTIRHDTPAEALPDASGKLEALIETYQGNAAYSEIVDLARQTLAEINNTSHAPPN